MAALSSPAASAGIDSRSSIFSATEMELKAGYAIIDHLNEGINWTPYSRDIKRNLINTFIRTEGYSFLFHKTADKIDGYIALHLHATKADTLYISFIAVDATAQSKGIGTELMKAAIEKTRELGLKYLGLHCEYELDNSYTFYTDSVPKKTGVEITEMTLDGIYADTGSRMVGIIYTV